MAALKASTLLALRVGEAPWAWKAEAAKNRTQGPCTKQCLSAQDPLPAIIHHYLFW